MEGIVFDERDALLRMTVREGQARILLCRTTALTQQAADTHLASDAAAAAMGRFLSGAAILGAMIKEGEGSVTVTADGDGAGGRLTAVVRAGDLKIAVERPQAELPPRRSGGQDVAGFVGSHGKLTVVKDFGRGEPYVGISELVSGGLGEDFAHYFTVSEQLPSLVALGCLNQDGVILSAGGILVQALPGCGGDTLDALEARVPFMSFISRELYDRPMRGLAEAWFAGLGLVIHEEVPLRLHCGCTRERMRSALRLLGERELREMAESGEEVPVHCHFCRARQLFSRKEILALTEGDGGGRQ